MEAYKHQVGVQAEHQKALSRRWWFISSILPLICAATAPLANLFAALAFFEPWVVFTRPNPGHKAHDTTLIYTLNSVALATAVTANILLLMNFARRIRYMIAQPTTVVLWYISGIAHIVALSCVNTGVNRIFSQAYYYALISCTMQMCNATMLLMSILPTLHWPIFRNTFPAYRPQALLSSPQRTIMFQTIIFTLYLALGGAIFSSIEGWTYLDGIYWTNYSLLTIGFGSDFLPTSPAAKIILVPYTAIGIFVLGLLVTSIRALFVARFRERVVWGKEVMKSQRRKWFHVQLRGYEKKSFFIRMLSLNRNPRKIRSRIPTLQTPVKWSRDEWEVMRYVKKSADDRRKYLSLLTTFSLFMVIWLGGSLVFWITERHEEQQAGKYTYSLSLYFTYVSLLTIGYGDVIPRSRAGRPVFVAWSLAAIPAMTLLISDIGDTLAKWVKEGPIEGVIGKWLIGTVDIYREDERTLHGMDEEEDTDSIPEKPRIVASDVSAPIPRVGMDATATREESEASHLSDLEKSYKEELRRAMTLVRGVRKIIQDDETKRYTWDEWEEMITLLGLNQDRGCEDGDISNWTWLGDEGPLFASGESEKIWILERIREQVDQKLEALLK